MQINSLSELNKDFETLKKNIDDLKCKSPTNTFKNLNHFNSESGCTTEPNTFNLLSNVLDKRVSTFVEQIEPLIRSNILYTYPNDSISSVYDHCDNYRQLSVRIKNSVMFELKNYVSLLEYDSIYRNLSQPDKFKYIKSNCCVDNFNKKNSPVDSYKPVHSIRCGPAKKCESDLYIEWKVTKFYGISGYEVSFFLLNAFIGNSSLINFNNVTDHSR